MSHFTWKAPIVWKGVLTIQKYRFIQIVADALGLGSFDWKGYPSELNDLRHDILEAIDKAMRVMD